MVSRINAIRTVASIALAGIIAAPVWAFTPPTLTDFNGDGVISAEEIAQSREARKATALQQYDTNGDGELSRAERKVLKTARRAAMVSQFDTDGDGELSRSEKKAAKEARRAAIEVQLDVDGDGTVSDAERAGYEEAKKDRRGKKGRHGHKKGDKHADQSEDTSA